MLKFIANKLLSSLALIFLITFVTFSLLSTNGMAIARNVLGSDATQAQVQERYYALGLDRPAITQYADWALGLFQGDLGRSFFTGQPVLETIIVRFPPTVAIVVSVMILTILLSAAIGTLAAVKGGRIDRVLQLASIGGSAVPNFITAIVLIFLFAIQFRIFPATGYVGPDESPIGFVMSLFLPVTAILIGSVSGAAFQFRGEMRDTLDRDFIRTLRCRGVDEKAILFRHALRSASGPALTVFAVQAIGLLGGVVIIEQVFAMPGIGQLINSSSQRGDIPMVMGCVILTALIVVLINLLLDIAQAWINPKVRLT